MSEPISLVAERAKRDGIVIAGRVTALVDYKGLSLFKALAQALDEQYGKQPLGKSGSEK